MLKKLLALILTFALILSAAVALSEAGTAKKAVTVMLYICGADLELKNFQATTTMATINQLKFNTDRVNVVALLGGTSHWSRGYDTDKLTLVELGGRRPKEVGSLQLSSMGAPATLTQYLDYCKTNYPAEKYDLIIWDHGGGPNNGVCFDMLFDDDSLSVNELSSAFAASAFADRGLDIIAFNTCLTGSAEYAYNLAPYANYMVATEDSMYGLDYNWLTTVDTDESSLATVKNIVDETYLLNKEAYERNNGLEINVVSAIALEKMPQVAEAMEAFFGHVTPNTNGPSFIRVSTQRRDTLTAGSTESNGAKNRDLADLGDLVRNLKDYDAAGADQLLSALDEAVVYLRSTEENGTGMTVYHPYTNKAHLESFMAVHNDIPLSAQYSSYIQQFAAMMTGTALADWSKLHTEPMVDKDQRTRFTLKLTDSQAENWASSRLYVLYQPSEGVYRKVFDSPVTELRENGLTGEFNGIALYALNGDQPISEALAYEAGPNGRILIPATLSRKGAEEGEDFTTEGLIVCTMDSDTKRLTPGAVQILDEASGGYTSIYGFTYGDFTEISLKLTGRSLPANQEEALPPYEDWPAAQEDLFTAPIDGSWSFGFLNDTIDTAQLYATFQVTDAQYNIYSSEPAKVKSEGRVGKEIRVDYDDAKLMLVNGFTAAPVADNLVITAEVENMTENESIIRLENLTLNGQAAADTAEAYGSGENWGLLKDEAQFLQVSLPIAGLPFEGPLTDITFDLNLVDAVTDESYGVVPVTVTLLLEL